MEGYCSEKRGFSLIELLIVLCIVSVLTTLITYSFQSGKRITSRYLAKSHLIKLQSIQSRYWLNSDAFVPLSMLPVIDTGGVEIIEVTWSTTHYEFTAVLSYFNDEDPCQTLVVTNTALLPRQCWLGN